MHVFKVSSIKLVVPSCPILYSSPLYSYHTSHEMKIKKENLKNSTKGAVSMSNYNRPDVSIRKSSSNTGGDGTEHRVLLEGYILVKSKKRVDGATSPSTSILGWGNKGDKKWKRRYIKLTEEGIEIYKAGPEQEVWKILFLEKGELGVIPPGIKMGDLTVADPEEGNSFTVSCPSWGKRKRVISEPRKFVFSTFGGDSNSPNDEMWKSQIQIIISSFDKRSNLEKLMSGEKAADSPTTAHRKTMLSQKSGGNITGGKSMSSNNLAGEVDKSNNSNAVVATKKSCTIQ